jgi:hypothetical protein
MSKEDLIWATVVALLIGLAVGILAVETRPIWAKERLVHEGVLMAYDDTAGMHFFYFQDPSSPAEQITVTETGWMWKTHLPLNATVTIHKRGDTIVVREVIEPSLI